MPLADAPPVKRLFRVLGYIFAAIAVAVILGTFVPRPLFHAADTQAPATHRILVLSNPIHTDIAIRLDAETRERFSFLQSDGLPLDAEGARYLVFGWGGRAFYIETPTWSELKAVPLLKGITADASAMHVGLAGDISEPDPTVAGYDLSDAAFERLLDHIRKSFRDEAGAPMLIPGAGYGQFDLFYEAHGTFTALLGCNTWSAGALRQAGLRTGWWNPLPALLRYSMALYN